MIRKITLLFLACFGIQFGASAQYCGFDHKHQQLLSNNPAYAQNVQAMNAQWSQEAAMKQFLQQNLGQLVADNNNGLGKVYEIPVVIHVVHTGGAVGTIYNPSDAQLIGMINYLNQAFAAMWGTYPDSMTGGTHVPIRFALAQRDTNCNVPSGTPGIVRVNGSSVAEYVANGVELSTSLGAPEVNVKNLSRWDVNRYYNIWIVNKIDGEDGTVGSFTAGYAYLPPAPANLDGTVMLATQATQGEITLVHEMGHALGLYHVFEGGSTSVCPPNANCNTDGDLICDTDPQMQSTFNCPTGTNPCTGMPFGGAVHNFMDYSSCQDRFTQGQRDRMISTLLQYRRNMIGALAGQPMQNPTAAVCNFPPQGNVGNSFNLGPRRVRIKDDIYTYLDYNSGGYNDEANQYYIDRTCHNGAVLEAGTVDTVLISVGNNSQWVQVYIDYNNDGVFNGMEAVYLGTPQNGTHSFVLNVPTLGTNPDLALCTPLRMRVVTERAADLAPNSCFTNNAQIEDYSLIIRATGVSGGTGSVTASLLTNNPSCFGDTLTFVATPSNGISPAFQWFVNGTAVPGATNDTFISNTPGNNAQVMVRIYYATTCSADSADSAPITVLRSNAVPPTVTMGVTYGSIPNCIDDTLTFSVLNTGNAGNNPTYQWQSNGIDIPGETGTSYTAANIPNNATITVILNSSSACAVPTSATSNGIVVTHGALTPSVGIALTNGNNPGCPGQILEFTATPANAGNISNISYQWRVNGINAGPNAPVFTGLFNNNDIIDVILTTTSSCATTPTATSNSITIIYTAVMQTVAITNVTAFPICSGRPVSFTSATTNSGNGAVYQWQVNGQNVFGANGPNFTTSTLAPGDLVTLVVTSSSICVGNPTAVSNTIVAGIIPSSVPDVTISLLQGSNPGCEDSVITFQGNINNFGTNPDGNWFVNGVFVGNGLTFTTATLDSGDVVTFMANQTDGACYTLDTVEVDMDMILYQTPQNPILSLLGNMLFINNNPYNYYEWFGPNGLIVGEHTQWYHPTIPGNYYVIRYNGACPSSISNIINISLLDIKDIEQGSMKVYPNPSNGLVTIDWGTEKVSRKIDVYNAVGQGLMHEEIAGESRKVLNLSHFAAGVYFLVVKNDEGATHTIRLTLTK
ncbi:MAG: T9SS type A sorting domain-containing protein [Flavipsychrobacter sp.]|nr:T9SS type A sorting domain-containing protein [Flavipsychrobacter sp.]